jgi:hypothetical protein
VSGQTGTPMNIEVNPRKAAARTRRRRRQEKGWAAKSGPVVTYKVGDPKPEMPPPK